jgi:hypothetical protein
MSDQKDLLPRAMKPGDFDQLGDVHHLDESIDNADQVMKDAAQDRVRLDKMRREYEKLYTELVEEKIRAQKKIEALQYQLRRVGTMSRLISEFLPDKHTAVRWMRHPRKYDGIQRVKLACTGIVVVLILLMNA